MFRNVYNKEVEIRRDLPDGRSAKLQLNRLRYEKKTSKKLLTLTSNDSMIVKSPDKRP